MEKAQSSQLCLLLGMKKTDRSELERRFRRVALMVSMSANITIVVHSPTFGTFFSYKLMHYLKQFAIVVLNGEITVYSVDSPKGFEW